MLNQKIRDYLLANNLQIIQTEVGAKQPPVFEEAQGLSQELKQYLHQRGIKLWRHQARAVTSALAGQDTVIATGTASGKTLSFALPVIDGLLANPDQRAFFLYPTKALAGDQLKTLERICSSLGLEGVVQKFDGDVRGSERKRALKDGRIFLINPDILHATLLRKNGEAKYEEIFINLKYVVLDECHVYTGAFGSNVALTMRRLRQVCRRHTVEPLFLAASATTALPEEQMKSLVGKSFQVIGQEDNGAPTGQKYFFLIDPQEQDYLEAAIDAAAWTLKEGRRFIMFCQTRKQTELQYDLFRERYPELIAQVMPYRSGYEAVDRQKIEEAMRNGSLKGVFSTSALELGVDLPDLDVCILAGLPGSKMSFLQRAGRVGRDQSQGVVLMFPSEKFSDQYYLAHPKKYFQRPLESCKIHIDNWKLLVSHIACALSEGGNWKDPELDSDIFGEDFCQWAKRVDELDEEIINLPEPHSSVSLRGIDDPTYTLELPERELGQVTYSQLLRETYQDAIYLHQGKRYKVKRIMHSTRQVKLEPDLGRTVTFPICHASVNDRPDPLRLKEWEGGNVQLHHTMLTVSTFTDGYRVRQGDKWLGNYSYPSSLKRRMVTEGVWLRLADSSAGRSGLNALAHAIANTYLLTELFEPSDLATHTVVTTTKDGSTRIYFYDTVSGGLGVSQGIYDTFLELLEKARQKLLPEGCKHCDQDPEAFDRGCPSCIATNRLYEDNEHLSKKEGLMLCDELIEIFRREPQKDIAFNAWKRRQSGGLIAAPPALEDDELEEIVEIAEKNSVYVYKPGSKVLVSTAKRTFEIIHDELEGTKVYYQAKRDDGTRVRLPHSDKLILQEGEGQWVCLGCGTTMEQMEARCPVCGMELAG